METFLSCAGKPQVKEKLGNLPMCPGVYIMKDKSGNIIYVGKSKLLKNRVSQYFQNSRSHSPKTQAMVEQIDDFDYIVTDTELEAVVLECNLIKENRPKYNVLLKDDKQYPHIKITLNEDFPRIFMTRKILKDGAKYYGPYMSAFTVRDTIETLKKIFKIRSCKNPIRQNTTSRPCLYYHMKQCGAPCAGKISKEEYNEGLNEVSDILNGNYGKIIKRLRCDMLTASENLEFEKAARLRDKIDNIKILGEKQKITSNKNDNRDVIGIFRENDDACIQTLYIRDGKTVGSEYFVFENAQENDSELLEAFVKQFYFISANIPKEILLVSAIEDDESIKEWLSQKAKFTIHFNVPKRGNKAGLVKLACDNAQQSLRQHKFKRDRESLTYNEILSELKKLLNLQNVPFRIESYDISNIAGNHSVGVCVVYKNTKPVPKEYRKFNIKTVDGANDYESMREVIFRRFSKMYEEQDSIHEGRLSGDKAKFDKLPDLILLDGGKGHVSVIKELLDTLGEDVPVYGLVKDNKHRTRALTDEHTDFPINHDSELFKFITRMQDEVHRFAITAYRKKHEKDTIKSELDDIKGVGAVAKNKLMLYFGSIDKIKSASVEELSCIVSRKVAENIHTHLRS